MTPKPATKGNYYLPVGFGFAKTSWMGVADELRHLVLKVACSNPEIIYIYFEHIFFLYIFVLSLFQNLTLTLTFRGNS